MYDLLALLVEKIIKSVRKFPSLRTMSTTFKEVGVTGPPGPLPERECFPVVHVCYNRLIKHK